MHFLAPDGLCMHRCHCISCKFKCISSDQMVCVPLPAPWLKPPPSPSFCATGSCVVFAVAVICCDLLTPVRRDRTFLVASRGIVPYYCLTNALEVPIVSVRKFIIPTFCNARQRELARFTNVKMTVRLISEVISPEFTFIVVNWIYDFYSSEYYTIKVMTFDFVTEVISLFTDINPI